MKRLFMLGLAVFALFAVEMSAQAPKREMRSSWVATVWSLDWPSSTTQSKAKSEIDQYLDYFVEHNFTGVCFQVRSMADALYKSSYEPWGAAVGFRGKNPGWDPLAYVVEQCHNRGLECYAWVNPYRQRTSATNYTTSYDKQWESDGLLLSNGSVSVFNPGLPAARAHILNVIKEIYTNYAIDGMVFDDYFYPSGGTAEGSGSPDYNLWRNSGTSLSQADWRRKNVNDFIKEIYNNIQADRPDMRFGISPAGVAGASASQYGLDKPSKGSDWQYAEIYSDPLAWMNAKAVDFISPQVYWTTSNTAAPFKTIDAWWGDVARHFGLHYYCSHSLTFLEKANNWTNWTEVGTQVDLHRSTSSNPGEIFYSAKNIDGMKDGVAGLGDYLGTYKYTGKSLVPVVTWKSHTAYAAPASLTKSGSTLTWAATSGAKSNSIIRYSIYAIPTSVEYENAKASNGDGLDGAYLLGVSYATSYSLPSDKVNGHYYAVCVYDGYGYESEPAFYGFNLEPSQATTLIAPKNGAKVEWNATFSWNAVSNATYTLEIANDAACTDIVISQSGLTATSANIDIAKLQSNTKYYWRVVTTQSGKRSTPSNVESFTTQVRTVGNIETGYTIMNDPDKYEGNTYEFTNLWMRSTKDGFGNFYTEGSGELNRGMVATDKYVYISGRGSNSATATPLYLSAYNALTGEHENDIIIGDNAQCSFYPCNDVIKDSEGNICITNLTLNVGNDPLKIFLVDVVNGGANEVVSLSGNSGRIDYAGIYGDVTTGNFYVFAAIANTNTIARWTVEDGAVTDFTEKTAAVAGFSTAPKVLPISENLVYVDGHTTSMTLYNFNDGSVVDTLNSAATPASPASNGQAVFSFDGKNFAVYAANTAATGYAFNLVASTSENVLADAQLLWNFPKGTMGSVNSGTAASPTDAVVVSANEARVYVYSPGNGIAAYSLKKVSTSITPSLSDKVDNMSIYSNVVVFDNAQEFIKAYNMAGIQVGAVENSTELVLPDNGYYIIVTPNKAVKVAIK